MENILAQPMVTNQARPIEAQMTPRQINRNTLGSSDGTTSTKLARPIEAQMARLINCNTLGSSDGNTLLGSSDRRNVGLFD